MEVFKELLMWTLFKFNKKNETENVKVSFEQLNVKERIRLARYASWIFTGVASFFLVLNFFFILTLYQMGSRLTVLVQLVTFPSHSNNVVFSEDLNENITSLNLINEALVRSYITKRYEIIADQVEMLWRWSPYGEVFLLSVPNIYFQFIGNRKLKEKVDMALSYAPVSVDIEKVSRSGAQNWIVEFNLIQKSGAVESLVASLRLVNDPSRIVYLPWFNNPVGATIIEYKSYPKKNM